MIWIGCHVSVSKGYEAMGLETVSLGGNTFAFFLRNPRGGRGNPPTAGDASALNALMQKNNFGPLVAHAPYTMNLCAARDNVRVKAEDMFAEDLAWMNEFVPGNFYNFHPGSHVGQGAEAAVQIIADALNKTMTPDMQTTVLLETMAGKGSEVGRSFEELKAIIDAVDPALQPRLGVCFDTCHTWDAGYDLVNSLEDVLTEFDNVIGLDRLKAVHFNDSKNECGSHKDRHEKLGQGFIGQDAMQRIAVHPLLQDKPFILETPNEAPGYAAEIAAVKGWFRQDTPVNRLKKS